jgi:hypothetical protein
MAENKPKAKDDLRLASSSEESYEVTAFAKKYGLPESEAALIIKRRAHPKRSSMRTWHLERHS